MPVGRKGDGGHGGGGDDGRVCGGDDDRRRTGEDGMDDLEGGPPDGAEASLSLVSRT